MSNFNAYKYTEDAPVTRAEFDTLADKLEELFQAVQIVERTQYGIQQMLGKAAEYKGKPRGRLPR